MQQLSSGIKQILKWADQWKCQCLMFQNLALWMDKHKLFQKTLQILATIVSFLTLVLSILSLRGKQQIFVYHPVFDHYLLASLQQIPTKSFVKQNCQYFRDLANAKYVAFDRIRYLKIRIAILFILWIVDMLGLLFAFVHPPCGTKMYVFGLVITLLFFVLFPSQFCINFGDECIQYSPIFLIYRIDFIIQYNVVWIGVGAIALIFVVYPLNYLAQKYSKSVCENSELFFHTIYGMTSIPFFFIGIINFIASLWTSSAIINTLTLGSMVINYLLYHASTTVRKDMIEREREIRQFLDKLPKNELDYGFYEDCIIQQSLDESQNSKQESLVKIQNSSIFKSPQKPNRTAFYIEWQCRLEKEFYET